LSACNPREAGELDLARDKVAIFTTARRFSAPYISATFLVDQKFPNRDDDENGQSDAIPDDTGVADFFLFDHAICLAADCA
jgi:hypothetical protein